MSGMYIPTTGLTRPSPQSPAASPPRTSPLSTPSTTSPSLAIDYSLNSAAAAFRLALPSLPILPTENIYESAAKLLFMSVKWAKSIPSFQQLPNRDQQLLLENCWSQLFLLCVAQWSVSLDCEQLVRDSLAPPQDHAKLATDATELREIIGKLVQLRLDHTEYTCLKALVLFKPEVTHIRQQLQVEVLQDQTHLMLQEYCLAKPPPANKVRFGRLLLMLPCINKFGSQAIEALFFRRTVGNIGVDRVIADLFQGST